MTDTLDPCVVRALHHRSTHQNKTAAAGSGNGSSRGAAAAANANNHNGDRGGAYPLMAPLVASWFKKGAGGSKAPVAASAAATLLVRADGEVDLELSMDGPGQEAAAGARSSLLELVAGRGGKQQRQQARRSLATTPSPAEAAKAAHRLFVGLATRALAPVGAAASGALRRLAALLERVVVAIAEAAVGAAAAGGSAAQRAARGPGALLNVAGRAAEALLTAAAAVVEEEAGGGDVREYVFPRDTAAFLGDTGKRVGASVLRAAAHVGAHAGRAGSHIKCVLGWGRAGLGGRVVTAHI